MREIVSPLDGIRSPFGSRRFAFSPMSLFASGEQGAWYEPSPSTCFTDTGGTTAASVGDPVARINDLSGNGNHATQATLASRPILRQTGGGLYYLEFDGTDDFMETPSITNTSTSGWAATAGVSADSLASGGIYAKQDSNAASAGSVAQFFSVNAASPRTRSVVFTDNAGGTPYSAIGGSDLFTATPYVLSGNVTSSAIEHSVDGVSGGSVAITGTIRTTAGPAFLGVIEAGPTYFNGDIYSLIQIDRPYAGSEQAKAEAYVASKTGVTL